MELFHEPLSALFALLATATAAFGAQAHTYTDNARVLGVEAQPRERERSPPGVPERLGVRRAPLAGATSGGAVVGVGLAGALLCGNQGRPRPWPRGRHGGRRVVGALTGGNIANRGRWEQPHEPVVREVTSRAAP
jgi:hypothetical protein